MPTSALKAALTMFVKLHTRITESSLMEEEIPTRYVFVMLLAIADPEGYVIGTDVALARRLNIGLNDFQNAISRLMATDPDSNSKDEDGRRLLPSDGERGYQIVNYLKYRDMRDEKQRRDYMRDYMADYRAGGKDKSRAVNTGKLGKPQLAKATAEATAVSLSYAEIEPPPGFPKSEDEAKAQAQFAGVPEAFAVTTYHLGVSRGFRDSKDVPIRNFRSYLKISHNYATDRNARYKSTDRNSGTIKPTGNISTEARAKGKIR